MKNKKSIIIICLFFLCLYSLPSEASDLNIVTTLPSLASITKSIGGDKVDVYSITRGVQDAHYIDAKPSYMLKLNKADLLIYSGLELEIGWLPLLIQGARNDKVTVGSIGNLNASLGIQLENILEKPRGEVDRSMGDVHPAGNPHYLLNPNNAMDLSELVYDKLSSLDPENQKVYEDNLNKFQDELKNKIRMFEQIAAPLRGKEVVCYHVHWSYLLNWLGISSAGYVELRPGIPPSPKHKRNIINLMKTKKINVVVISSWKDPTKAQEVADAVGAKLVVLPGEVNALEDTDDYFNWMDYMVNKLTEAFASYANENDNQKQKRNRERKRGN